MLSLLFSSYSLVPKSIASDWMEEDSTMGDKTANLTSQSLGVGRVQTE
jgi:hypothetical protein